MKLVILLFISIFAFSACKKKDQKDQAHKDEGIITKYIVSWSRIVSSYTDPALSSTNTSGTAVLPVDGTSIFGDVGISRLVTS